MTYCKWQKKIVNCDNCAVQDLDGCCLLNLWELNRDWIDQKEENYQIYKDMMTAFGREDEICVY